MEDSMPPAELNRCNHPWESVVITEQKTVVGEMEMPVETTKVYFCDSCDTVLEEV